MFISKGIDHENVIHKQNESFIQLQRKMKFARSGDIKQDDPNLKKQKHIFCLICGSQTVNHNTQTHTYTYKGV